MNSPIPQTLGAECKKAAKILDKFINPEIAGGFDEVIPRSILSKAKGFAIFTVVKAGFVWSGRLGSGLVVARNFDNTWSAPSAIGTGGVGFGGQIGAQITDFVIILNTDSALKAFSEGGNVTLGGSLSVAAGPVGRSAEISGAVAHFAAIYSYSKSKGLFVGVSLEGSAIYERKDANTKFYGRKIKAKELLKGYIKAPEEAQVLYDALDKRLNDSSFLANSAKNSSIFLPANNSVSSLNNGSSPPPLPKKPINKVIAKYDFIAQEEGDLSFRKGDIIKIINKTDNDTDWWQGELNGETGQFPSNYVDQL